MRSQGFYGNFAMDIVASIIEKIITYKDFVKLVIWIKQNFLSFATIFGLHNQQVVA
jgi:hypothetical protein